MPETTNNTAEIEPRLSAEPASSPVIRRGTRPYTAGRERTNQALERSTAQGVHAEIFYLQKQVQSQTVMVIQLEDGEKLEGKIEWFDRDTIKICSKTRQRVLIFKSAIKYIYKIAEHQHAPSGTLR
jgi:sRNA-binding regulator protein Hfq